jgi:hypothetical protein
MSSPGEANIRVEKQIDRLRKINAMGKRTFILRFGVFGWGLGMLAYFMVKDFVFEKRSFDFALFAWLFLSCLAGGALCGKMMYFWAMRKLRQIETAH